jgi:hypothetical protein
MIAKRSFREMTDNVACLGFSYHRRPVWQPEVNAGCASVAAMGDSRVVVEDYLTLALGFETQAANAIDPRLSEELRKTAQHYRFLAADVERRWQRRERE